MSTITIRNLPPETVERLKRRAARNGRSMEQEAREILGRRLGSRDEILRRIEAWGHAIPPPPAALLEAWVAEARQGRPGAQDAARGAAATRRKRKKGAP